jgi:mono/diheme cytochrome c family protein
MPHGIFMDKRSCTYKFSAVAAIVALSAILQSCESRGTDDASPYETFTGGNMPFAELKVSALSSCVQCHSDFNSEDGISKDIVAGDPEHSILYQMLESGAMPKGRPPLSASELAMVRAYIMAVQVPVIPILPVWSSLQQVLFERSCITCHKTGGKKPYLDTYDSVEANTDDIDLEISTGDMPPKGKATPPTAEIIKTFETWVSDSCPK